MPPERSSEDPVVALIKSVPGNVSLESPLTEIRKLRAVRANGLPGGLFGDIAPRVVAVWRARATVESPSHLRDHPEPLLTLLAALLYTQLREITDTAVAGGEQTLRERVHEFKTKGRCTGAPCRPR